MLINGNTLQNASNVIESDIVIIGAGTVGLYMAARILKDDSKRSICIVESGDISPSIEYNIENSKSIGKNHIGTLYGRYSGIGGTSSNWGGQLAEFEAIDFERKDSEWPIDFKEMKFYYNEVYSFLGLKIPVSTSHFNTIFRNNTSNNYKIESYYTVRLKNKDTVFAEYFNKQINHESIKILTNTTAYKIKFKESTANELICRSSNGRNISIKASKYIFASGTLGINQFFLSTQLRYDVPWKSNEYIGKYFQDHLGGVAGCLRLEDEKKFRDLFEKRLINGIKVEHKLKFRRKYRIALDNGVVLSFKYHTEDIEHLNRLKLFIRELFYKNKLHNVKHFLGDLYRLRKYLFAFGTKFILKKRIHQFIDNGIEVFVQSEQIPLANSQISVVENESLSNGLFKILVDWNWNGREIEAIQEASVELKRYLKDHKIGDFEIDEGIIKRDLEVLDSFQDTYHLCGGMRMSESDKYGVVDPNCRVWGTNNVWVAGAAVFPSSSHANSTLTALALTERIVRNSL